MGKISTVLGELFAPAAFVYRVFKERFDAKLCNFERFLSVDDAFNLPVIEARLIMYFLVVKDRKGKTGEENQQLKLSYTELKHHVPNKKSFYSAINGLIDKGIIEKVPDKQSVYKFNPFMMRNLTNAQALEMKVTKPNPFNGG